MRGSRNRGSRNSFLIASCIAIATTIWDCGSSSQHYIASANQFYASGRYVAAALEYRNAIQKDAQSGEAYYRLGLAQLKLNHGSEAYEELSRPVALSPQNFSAKERLASFSFVNAARYGGRRRVSKQ